MMALSIKAIAFWVLKAIAFWVLPAIILVALLSALWQPYLNKLRYERERREQAARERFPLWGKHHDH